MHHSMTKLLFALLLTSTLFAEEQAPTASDLFDDGRDALFSSDYEKAVKLLKQAVAADQDKTLYRLHLARAERYAGRPEESEKLLVKILEEAPDHVEAGQLLADILVGQERWERVLEVLEPLLRFRHDYRSHHLLAEAAYNSGDHDKARGFYQEAIRLNPNSGRDHYQLANLHLAGRRFALAAEGYERAIGHGLESAILHYKLGSAYFNLRNFLGRVAIVEVPSGEAGRTSGEWFLLEEAPQQQDHFRASPSSSALYQVARAMEMGMQDNRDIQMLLANIYLKAHRYQTAYDLYAKLAPEVPEDDRALANFYLAEAALGLDKLEDYLVHLRKAADLDKEAYESTLVDGYLKVADKHHQAGEQGKTIEFLVLAVRESPQTASLHLRLADAYNGSKQHDKAVEQWRLVLDLEPDHPQRTQLLTAIERQGE